MASAIHICFRISMIKLIASRIQEKERAAKKVIVSRISQINGTLHTTADLGNAGGTFSQPFHVFANALQKQSAAMVHSR